MLSREQETGPVPLVQPQPSWVVRALEGPVLEGERNVTATRLAGHFLPQLRNKVEEVTALLSLWASARCQPPLDLRELRGVVESVARREDSFRSPRDGDGTKSNFQPIHIADLLATEPPPMVWCWERFIPEGSLVALVSYMKVGKSTLAYPLAIAVAQGQPFLGYPTTQGGVLILAVEEHERDVRRRLERFGARAGDPIHFHTGQLRKVKQLFPDLREFITEHQIRLVLLDTLPQFWEVRDENDNAQVIREVKPFLDLARSTQAAVVLLHHERKSGGEHGRGIRGGSALFGMVDQAILLDRQPGGATNQRVLKTIGRYDESPSEVVVELTPEGFENRGTPQEVDLETEKSKVLAALSSTPVDLKTLTINTGVPKRRIGKILEALGDQVVQDGRGVKGEPHRYRLAA